MKTTRPVPVRQLLRVAVFAARRLQIVGQITLAADRNYPIRFGGRIDNELIFRGERPAEIRSARGGCAEFPTPPAGQLPIETSG